MIRLIVVAALLAVAVVPAGAKGGNIKQSPCMGQSTKPECGHK